MKYNHHWIKKKLAAGETLSYVFFWGHRPNKDGTIGKTCFSQWFNSPFEHESVFYRTAEHWMMAEKARLFGDKAILERILKSSTPLEAKKLGRKVRNFDEKTWKAHRKEIVLNGNYLKFSQHNKLWDFLNQTGDKIIVEASPYDTIWGIGMVREEPGIEDPDNWRGLNLLGYALMEVRDKIRMERD